MGQNMALIFQPIWNVFIKLGLLVGFMILIGVSLSSGSISPSNPSVSIPDPQNPANSITIVLGGIARSFDMV